MSRIQDRMQMLKIDPTKMMPGAIQAKMREQELKRIEAEEKQEREAEDNPKESTSSSNIQHG